MSFGSSQSQTIKPRQAVDSACPQSVKSDKIEFGTIDAVTARLRKHQALKRALDAGVEVVKEFIANDLREIDFLKSKN